MRTKDSKGHKTNRVERVTRSSGGCFKIILVVFVKGTLCTVLDTCSHEVGSSTVHVKKRKVSKDETEGWGGSDDLRFCCFGGGNRMSRRHNETTRSHRGGNHKH